MSLTLGYFLLLQSIWADEPCLEITHFSIQDSTQKQLTLADAFSTDSDCYNLETLYEKLLNINLTYHRNGFLTSEAVFQPFNLLSKNPQAVTIQIKEDYIGEIIKNDDSKPPLVFVGIEKTIFNLYDLQYALKKIQKRRYYKTNISASETPQHTDIILTTNPQLLKWLHELEINNYHNHLFGHIQLLGNVSTFEAMTMGENWNLKIAHTRQSSQTYYLSVSTQIRMPYNIYYSYQYDYQHTKYSIDQISNGNLLTVDGNSHIFSFSISKRLKRMDPTNSPSNLKQHIATTKKNSTSTTKT